MDRALQDLRFAIRFLWRDRSFALTTLLTLAVCIGANAAIFAIINSVLLRPLPVPEPAQLVRIFNSYPRAGVERASNGVPDYYDRLREVDVFEEQALYNTRLIFPFFKDLIPDLGWGYLPFAVFVLVASSNAVNLTDG